MSLRRGERRRGRVGAVLTTVGALVAFQALAIVGAGVAYASTCVYNPATDTISITIDAGETVAVAVEGPDGGAGDLDAESPAGAILANLDGLGFENGAASTACGSATNSNTAAIVVLGQPSADENFVINNNVGSTGLTGEFATSIAWSIDLGTGTGDGLQLHLGNGDDTVTVTDTSFTINGGGAAPGDLLGVEFVRVAAEDGDDVVDASTLTIDSVINGDTGDDFISPGLFDGDLVNGGLGTDTLSYATRTTPTVVVNGVEAGHDANANDTLGDAGDENDTLVDCFEVVMTGSGNDFIDDAGCGNSVYAPGAGDDDVVGDDFGDTLSFETSTAGVVIDIPNETATGQGTDTWTALANFIGSEFDDTMLVDDDADGFGGSPNSFSGLGGVDTVDGSQATDGISIDIDVLDPSDPNDDLENAIGGAGNDNIEGNDLANVLTGNGGDDFLEGTEGRDTLDGGAGNDFLEGDESNDLLNGGPGDDTFNGGAGADTVTFISNTTAGVNVDLSLGFATSSDSGDDSFDDLVEIIVGSNFKDTITGGPFGGGGTVNFLFKGKAKADLLTGFAGNDTLNGGKGPDTLRGSGGDDLLRGKKGADTLVGGRGFDIGKGGPGFDVCRGVEAPSSCV
jgi:Ca2+-binding RTX toxin-like protein